MTKKALNEPVTCNIPEFQIINRTYPFDSVTPYSSGTSPEKDENMNHSPKKLNNPKTENTPLQKYKNFKFKLRASFRKSKDYLKNEKKRLSNALDRGFSKSENVISSTKPLTENKYAKAEQSDFEVDYTSAIELLKGTSNDQSLKKQLENTVSICRQIPELETSSELVEAERLLLYTTLKEKSFRRSKDGIPPHNKLPGNAQNGVICIHSFEIPIKSDLKYDSYFSYFYIGVFTHGSDVKSTDSVERHDGTVYFRNINMLFHNLNSDFEINVDLYVLRLRKFDCTKRRENTPIKRRSNSLSDSKDEIVSRFQMHGNFVIRPSELGPYAVRLNCDNLSQNNGFTLLANNLCSIPITLFPRNINLLNEGWLTANVLISFENFKMSGYLDVADTDDSNKWSKYWCKLNGLTLNFWNNPHECGKDPIFEINLSRCVSYPITYADRKLCTVPRSFTIKVISSIDANDMSMKTFLFSTENQESFQFWISGLNEVVEFIKYWKVKVQ